MLGLIRKVSLAKRLSEASGRVEQDVLQTTHDMLLGFGTVIGTQSQFVVGHQSVVSILPRFFVSL